MAVFSSLGAAALGGCWWPLFIMPRWLQNLARITPHAWANSAFNKLMLFGATPQDVVPELGALVLFAVLFGVLGVWRFRLG
jgi:ABC-2 type transport system permease protein